MFKQNDASCEACEAGCCDAFPTNASHLTGIRLSLPRLEEYVVPPDLISKELLAPAVRHGHDQ